MKRQATLAFGGGGSLAVASERRPTAAPAKRLSPAEPALLDLTVEEEDAPPPRASAFALMMQKAKEPTPREDFVCCFVGGGPGGAGHWDWAWGPRGHVALGGLAPGKTVALKCAGAQGKPAEVALYTNVPSFSPEGLAVGPAPVRPAAADAACRFSPSLLKSLLQKAVRRGLAEGAVALAAELWARGPVDALRRLLVIVIEDALLHPAQPALTFFMMRADENYALGPLHAACYLAVVRDICACGARDALLPATPPLAALAPPPPPPSQAPPPAGGECAWRAPLPLAGGALALSAAHLAQLGAGASAHVRALQARALFGGLAGDCAMLRSAAALWALRFAHDAMAKRGGARAAEEGGGGGGGGGAGGALPAWLAPFAPPPPSKSWVALLAAAHGARLASSSFHGPFTLQFLLTRRVRLEDCPLAGVDHHVSEIVEDVLRHGGAFEAPGSGGGGGGGGGGAASGSLAQAVAGALALLEREEGVARADCASALCSLMWTLRSSLNARRELAGGQGGGGGGGCGGSSSSGPSSAARRAFALLEPHFDAFARRLLASRLG